MTTWTVILGLALVAGSLWVIFKVILPLHQLRETLRRLAAGDFRPVLLNPRVFRETTDHLRRISEQLQHLDQRASEEAFSLHAILSSMGEGVLIIDADQKIRLANESLQQMFPITQSPIDRSVMEVFRNHELQQTIALTLSDRTSRRLEISVNAPNRETATTKCLDVYVGALTAAPQGPLPGAVIVVHDITVIKNLEAVRREFVANVSHEFRTPLSLISGYTETLLDGAIDDRPTAEKFLKVMQKNCGRLTLLIEDLLTISRLESRSSEVEYQTVHLPDVLTQTMERLAPAIARRSATIKADWAPDAMEVAADLRKIEQVFANLLENALRHGPDAGTLVTITTARRAAHIEILLSDNGPGIPQGDQEHIFERFYRVQKHRAREDRDKTDGGGTGLGLSIVKHLVQVHGGEISLESESGRGASFKILLPITRPIPPGGSRGNRNAP